jgi:mono/diheme cytochrome c family protein
MRSAGAAARRSALALALIGVGLGVAGFCRGGPQGVRGQIGAAPPDKLQAARALFKRHCTSCHGSDGTGRDSRDTTPEIPDFSSRQWQDRRSKAQLTVSIRDGRGTHMPAFRKKISDSQVDDLIELIRTFVPKSSKSLTSPEDFERRWQELQDELDQLKRLYEQLVSAAGGS